MTRRRKQLGIKPGLRNKKTEGETIDGASRKNYIQSIESTLTRQPFLPLQLRSIFVMNKSQSPDADLIRSIVAGNKEDFRILMERYQQKIYSYLYYYHNNPLDFY